jgi:DNA-binding LacI/PurR family transcriptional regulator
MSVRSIARDLGVSATAVSLALKNSPRVSAELRAAVQKKAVAAGHVPNARLAELMSEVRQSGGPTYRATMGVISLFPEERPWLENPNYGHLQLVLQGAREAAAAHGYRLEDFWVKRPGLRPARLRAILEARGIRGLLCLGSLDPEERFPAALKKFAVVTHASSIPDPLHRVVSHHAADARTLFDELLRRGYARPGLIILVSGDRRTDHLYTATFLGHQERKFAAPPVPVLRAETWNEDEFATWFSAHLPDAVVLHQYTSYLERMEVYLARRRIQVPRDLGLALLDKNPDLRRYSGICQDPVRMGVVEAEMLLGRIMLRDFGPPLSPKIELVQGRWNEGRTLRRAKAARG